MYLLDSDSVSLKKASKKLQSITSSVVLEHYDVTGVIDAWSKAFNSFCKKNKKTTTVGSAQFLDTLQLQPHAVEVPTVDITISLNILGQIPIYLRERFKTSLSRYCKIYTNDEDLFAPPLEAALQKLFSKMQHEHLRLLQSTSNTKYILLTDTLFYYYQNDKSFWQVYPALPEDLHVMLLQKTVAHDSWLWHIAPQGIEDKTFGSIHQIDAFSFNA